MTLPDNKHLFKATAKKLSRLPQDFLATHAYIFIVLVVLPNDSIMCRLLLQDMGKHSHYKSRKRSRERSREHSPDKDSLRSKRKRPRKDSDVHHRHRSPSVLSSSQECPVISSLKEKLDVLLNLSTHSGTSRVDRQETYGGKTNLKSGPVIQDIPRDADSHKDPALEEGKFGSCNCA